MKAFLIFAGLALGVYILFPGRGDADSILAIGHVVSNRYPKVRAERTHPWSWQPPKRQRIAVRHPPLARNHLVNPSNCHLLPPGSKRQTRL